MHDFPGVRTIDQIYFDLSSHNAGFTLRDELFFRSSRVDQLKEGAFSPFSQQPLVRAVLLPLGTFGWKVLIENGMLPGL